MKRLLPILLLCAGCGSTDTAFSPTEATAAVPTQAQTTQARHLVARLDNGGQVGLVLTPTGGSTVSGRAVLARGSEKLPMQASGILEGDRVSLRLTPDSRGTATRAFVITGPLAGSGKWADRAAGTTGNLTLTEAEPLRQRTGMTIGQRLFINIPAQGLGIGVTATDFHPDSGNYHGNWSSNLVLGPGDGQPFYNQGRFVASVDPTGEATVTLHTSVGLANAGLLQFTLPTGTAQTPLNPESDVVLPSDSGKGAVTYVNGTVEVGQ